MSLKVDTDNIFFLLPESRYAVSDRIDGWMEKDFTLYLRFKIFPEELEIDKEAFAFSRNGKHSGISVIRVDETKYIVNYTYWFVKTNANGNYEYLCKQIYYELPINELNEFNEYIMICDSSDGGKIDCYFNKELIGTIKFEDYDRLPYEHAFYWFGCGSMICEEQHRYIGKFEYNTAFVLNTKLTLDELSDIVDNYETKYTSLIYNGLRVLNDDFKYKANFAFFCDFKQYNRYKIWDISFNGNYPQFYIENNIYF
jgi:hypothetical protein